jgi:hypothetical protein
VKKVTSSTANDVQNDDKVSVARKKKKGKKASAKIVDFDETDVGKMREHREASVSASSDTRSESSALSTSKVVDSGKVSPTPSLSYDPVRLKNSKATSSTKNSTSKSVDTENDDETDLDIYSRSSVDDFDPATISADPKLSTLSKLTPVRNVEIGGLIPLSANGEIRHDLQVSILSGICPLKICLFLQFIVTNDL